MSPRIRHYTSYLIFGVVTTLVNLLIYKLLIDMGVHYAISTTIAFIVAVSVAFWTNRIWVFQSRSRGMKAIFREMTSFFSVRLLTYLVDVVGLVVLIELVHLDEFISKLLVNGLVIVLNYLLSRFVVFQARAE
ncbi:GtrA family protein [Anoxynatronum buryatiense]|uniref:Flippase GtrA (Transmembrane translocase of bactoprenol-linked glucose) n=1 Tax=Anoxynatronum buryatiense TaxID=489973 RepID=A0AA46AJ13_9CLOT|nr:GtrA family protein [Anoxynatronum buryatiense]SMP55225.1 Putative flippase GtrA (transmembrane translocase of bactoprenol-linked glucose) [Anoxynatronum buryatiense]